MYIGDPGVADLMLRASQGPKDLSAQDGIRFHFLTSNIFLMIEDEFRHYQAGLISAERHNGFVRRFSRSFDNLGYRAAWAMQREGFEPDFRHFMDSLVQKARENGLPPNDWSRVWQAAIAAELEGHRSSRDSTSLLPNAAEAPVPDSVR